jgi:ARG/rhodanese/phosphatase superfamily protein
MSNSLVDLLSQVKIHEKQSSGPLEVFPLFSAMNGGPAYVTLKQALEQNWIRVTELTNAGSVPQLRVVNSSDHLVLLLDGEELVGAKQNRVLNTSVLLNAKTETVIPVSCTEQGRWSFRSESFADSGVVMASKARSLKSLAVMASLSEDRGFDSNQGQVWSEISEMQAKAGVRSSTGAMKDVYTSQARELDAYVRAFPCLPEQQGILVATGGRIAGLDFVSCKKAYVSLHEKLVKSYAMEAILDGQQPVATSESAARLFLNELADSREAQYPSVGVGQDVRLEGRSAVGSALVYQDTVIHLASFHMEGQSQESGMAGFARPRRYQQRRTGGDVV